MLYLHTQICHCSDCNEPHTCAHCCIHTVNRIRMLYFLVSSVLPLDTQNGETAVILAAQKGHRELLLHLVNHYKCAAQEKDNVSPYLTASTSTAVCGV